MTKSFSTDNHEFVQEVERLLENLRISYVRRKNCFVIEKYFLNLFAVPLDLVSVSGTALFEDQNNGYKDMYLYEDFWRRDPDVAYDRLMAHLGEADTVFARNCRVERITADEIRDFMNRYHSYGFAKARYHYGIYDEIGDMVAAASFSAPRSIPRDVPGKEDKVIFKSYEWVRYASLPDVRVVGGMGKVLSVFEREVHPDDIMSYADVEWSSGDVYEKLGFEKVGTVPPVEFLVDRTTFRRYSVKKIRTGEIQEGCIGDNSVRISNLGSVKYLKIYLKGD